MGDRPTPRGGLRSVGDRLRRLGIATTPAGEQPSALARLAEVWSRVVPEAARHARPARITRAGIVTIACDDAGWAQELGAQSDDLLDRLRPHTEDIAVVRLRFVVGDRPTLATPGGVDAPAARPAPTRAHQAIAESAVGEVSDPELRAALKRAIAASLALREQGGRRGDADRR